MSYKTVLAFIALACVCSQLACAFSAQRSYISQHKVTSHSFRLSPKMSSGENNRGLEALLKQAKLLPAIIGSAMIIMNPFVQPDAAHAARSGGRSGGSSFRPSGGGGGSSRSYGSAMRGSSQGYSSYAPRPMIGGPMIMPMYGYGGFGISPFSFIPINFNLLVLGAVAYTVYSVLKNRAGSSDFSGFDNGDSGSLGGGVSVIKIQLGLDADWNERGNIMETLELLSQKNAAMSGRGDISRLLSDASLSLLRKQSDWNSAAYESSYFNQMGAAKGQPLFQQLAIKERSKFEEEKGSDSMPLIKRYV